MKAALPAKTPVTTTPRPVPTLRGRGFFTNLRQLRQDPLALLTSATAEHGDVVRVRVAHLHFFVFRHPDAVKHILQDHAKGYGKTPSYEKMKLFLGEGLLTAEGDFWLRQRRMAQPGFHRERLAALAERMTAEAGAAVERWRALVAASGGAAEMDLSAEVSRLTMSIAGTTLFGMGLGERDADEVGRAVAVMQEETDRRAMALYDLPLWLPTAANRRARAAVAALDEVVYRMIGARRKRMAASAHGQGSGDDGRGHDLLQMLLDARDEDGRGMSDRALRDEVTTIFIAGHETTANALGWTFFLLARHPDVEARLRAELAEVLGGRAPALADLARLSYTQRVLDESMRLYPPAWAMERRALADDEVAGVRLPAGSLVSVSPWLTHRHPEFWPEPERFDPDRFAPERAAARPRYAYFPFGGGPRMCIGRDFALMEMQLVLPVLLQAFRYAPAPGQSGAMLPQITLRPLHPLRFTITAA